MKEPTEKEIIEELVSLKHYMKSLDFQMGIGGIKEKNMINRLNKIIRMVKCPVRRVTFNMRDGGVLKAWYLIVNQWGLKTGVFIQRENQND